MPDPTPTYPIELNNPYNSFFLSSIAEDAYASHLDMQKFAIVDNELLSNSGMKRTINVYRATGSTQKLLQGQGNDTSISVTFTPHDYVVQCAQNRFEYYDEEAMKDPMIVPTGVEKAGASIFDLVNDDIYGQLLLADSDHQVTATSPDFAAFVDAATTLNSENIEGEQLFAILHPTMVGTVRKALADSLKYVESYARTGYIGSVAGINLYARKSIGSSNQNKIAVATSKAVTIFNKKGMEVEQNLNGSRSEDNANERKNSIFTRKYYVVALTDATKAALITVGS